MMVRIVVDDAAVAAMTTPDYIQEFIAELRDVCDNHFADGEWYLEVGQ